MTFYYKRIYIYRAFSIFQRYDNKGKGSGEQKIH